MFTLKVAILGLSNVGKTTLINIITNSNMHVGNFDGTTVEIEEVFYKHKEYIVQIIDLPGLGANKLQTKDGKIDESSAQIDHIIVTKYIANQNNYDTILCVLDGKTILEDLEIIQQNITNVNKPIVYAVTMVSDCPFVFSKTEAKTISKLFSAPVIFTSKRSKKSYKLIIDELINQHIKHSKAQQSTAKKIDMEKLKSFFQKKLRIESKKKSITSFIDSIVMNRFLAIPIFLGIISIMFYTVFHIGSIPELFIESTCEKIGKMVTKYTIEHYIVSSFGFNFPTIAFMIKDGILPSISTLLSFLPRVLITMLWISLLEQTGYMARLTVALEDKMNIFGMHGKSIISLITGLGCTVPAYITTRILPTKKQRLVTMIATSLIPCHAKMIVFIFCANAFFPNNPSLVLTILYSSGILLALLFAKIASVMYKSDDKEDKHVPMRLQPYSMPDWKNIVNMLILRSKEYLCGAGVVIITIAFTVWIASCIPANIMNQKNWNDLLTVMKNSMYNLYNTNSTISMTKLVMENSVIGTVGRFLSTIFIPIGFDWRITISLLTAMTAKEICIATISVLYFIPHTDGIPIYEIFGNQVSVQSGVSFMIIILIWIPCTSALAVFAKEHNNTKETIKFVTAISLIAWIAALIGYHITKLIQ